ncbi:MAG: HlyD family efflux transporter periplasmic adaptor subunit [Actinomycetota bacterium]
MEGTPSPVARVDQIALFGRPRMWVALIAILLLIAGLLSWGFLARTPVTVAVSGLITTAGGISDIGSSITGTVTAVYVEVGDRVDVGNNVVAIEDDLGRTVDIKATVPGQVLELATRVGDFVSTGDGLLILQTTGEPLIAIALVPVTSSGGLSTGQSVLISPTSAASSEYGFIHGTVDYVSAIPVSPARLAELNSGIAGVADPEALEVPVVEVDIVLASADTASGYSWTIGSGPPYRLLAGTPFMGQIIIGEQSPLVRLLG